MYLLYKMSFIMTLLSTCIIYFTPLPWPSSCSSFPLPSQWYYIAFRCCLAVLIFFSIIWFRKYYALSIFHLASSLSLLHIPDKSDFSSYKEMNERHLEKCEEYWEKKKSRLHLFIYYTGYIRHSKNIGVVCEAIAEWYRKLV